MPDWVIALIGGAAGATISEIGHWMDRFQRFKDVTFEKRLAAYQEALSQIYRIYHALSSEITDDGKLESVKKAESWWEDNQLLLDVATRRQMLELFAAANDHILGQAVKQSDYIRAWRKTRETIYKGIGSKYLPSTRYEEEAS